jgi:hypothetical protein
MARLLALENPTREEKMVFSSDVVLRSAPISALNDGGSELIDKLLIPQLDAQQAPNERPVVGKPCLMLVQELLYRGHVEQPTSADGIVGEDIAHKGPRFVAYPYGDRDGKALLFAVNDGIREQFAAHLLEQIFALEAFELERGRD